MVEKIKYLGVILLSHYLLYPFYLDAFSNSLQQLLIFGSLLIYAIINKEIFSTLFKGLREKKMYFTIAMLLFSIILLASFFIPIIYQTMDFSYLSSQIRHVFYLLMYIILLAMIRIKKPAQNLKNEFMKLFTLATRNYVVFTMVLLAVGPFREFWLNFIHETPRRLELLEMPIYFARIGWAGYSGFSVTFFCTIAVLFSIYLILHTYEHQKKISIKEVINMFFALIGNAFYGRSGLLVSLILIIIGAAYFVFINRKIKYIVYLVSAIVIIFMLLTIIKEFNSTLASWYSWMMQPFVSLIESGRIETSSTDALWEMWFIPDDSTILFGDGFYTSPLNGRYYMGTDVGFLRPLLFFGSTFMTTIYIVPATLSIGIASKNRLNKFFAFLTLITLFIFEIKAEVVFLLIPILIILFIGEFSSREDKENTYKNNRSYKTIVTEGIAR